MKPTSILIFLSVIFLFAATHTAAQNEISETGDSAAVQQPVMPDNQPTPAVIPDENADSPPKAVQSEPEPEKEKPVPAASTETAPEPKPKKEPPAVQPKQTATPKAASAQAGQAPSEPEPESKPEAKEDEPGSGLKIQPGLTFGTMTRNGETWTRFSFRPEISFGKLGVALDLELFMNEKQEFDSYGWNFDTFDNGMESILRKIYYVRWGQPGDRLFLKAGSLEDVTLGYGLIMNGYGNIAFYPDKKLVGFHGQINHIPLMDLGIEVVLNNYQELFNGEGVIGARAHFAPIGALSLPLISKIRLGGSVVSDINQLATFPDRDGDNCPDVIDINVKNARVCKGGPSLYDSKVYDENLTLKEARLLRDDIDDSLSRDIKEAYKDGDQFTLLSFDAGLPIINSKLLNLTVYSELAFQAFQNSDALFDGGYGLIFPGVLANVGPLSGSLEYRIFNQPFHPGHFNGWYEAERALVSQGEIVTKEQKYWADSLDGVDKGIYGSLGLDLKGLATVGASYEVMFPEGSGFYHGYTGRASLGESITSLIPKLASGSIFWKKDRVGDDLNEDGDPGSSDGFFESSIYTYYGYSVGIQMGANMTITVNRITTHTRDDKGKLTKATNMSFETAVSF